jgi:hypothetical protein
LTQLVTEVACNPAFGRWLFTHPASALAAIRDDASNALGPGLPGPEFEVPAIVLNEAQYRAVLSFGARTLTQLANAVRAWEQEQQAAVPEIEASLVAVS